MTVSRRYRFLWILGLLAGGGSVMLPSGAGNQPGHASTRTPGGPSWLDSATGAVGTALPAWAAANLGLLVGLAVIAVGAVLALIVASFIARGSIAQATTDIATGHTVSFASAWRAGLRLFWRYVGLWALLIGAAVAVLATVAAIAAVGAVASLVAHSPAPGVIVGALAVAAAVAGFVAYVLDLTRANGTARWKVALGATLFALPIFTVLLVVALSLSIVVAFAQRAIVVENLGPIDALRSGWRLLRTHIAESLMTWLVNAALALVSGIAGVGAALGFLVAFAAVGALVFAAAGIGTPLFAYAGLGGLLLLLGGLTLIGVINTFFWSYWTLVYLQLSKRGTAREVVA